MSVIDYKYHNLLKEILNKGYETYDKSRGLKTSQLSHYTLDLRDSLSVPILTTKKVFHKSVLTELLFFLRGETNIKYLLDRDCNIWNKDAYSYYIKLCKEQKITTMLGFKSFIESITASQPTYMITLPKGYKLGDLGPVYGNQWHRKNQLDNCIKSIMNGNFNRRLLVNGWNVEELDQMVLPPCHWAYEFIQEKDGFILKWHQRSVDTFLGLPFNIFSFYSLGKLVSWITGIPFYGLIGDLSNVHIYENHFDQVKEQLLRDPFKHSTRSIKYLFNAKIYSNFLKYRSGNIDLTSLINSIEPTEISLINYESYPAIKAEMVAQKV